MARQPHGIKMGSEKLSETYNMALSVKLMAMSQHLKSGDFATEIEKISNLNQGMRSTITKALLKLSKER